MGWNTTKLITVGSLAVLEFLIWLPSSFIFASSGSVFGATLQLFFGTFLTILTLLIVKEFGTATLFSFLNEFIGIPLPHVIPMPFTFFHVLRGFILDCLFILLKVKEKLASVIIGGIENFLVVITMYIILIT